MHETFMKRAIELSREKMQSNHGGPFGAVIVKDGQIVAEGWNEVTSTCDPTAHAEVMAIRKACQNLKAFHLKGCEIYTSCEPCPMCLSAIYWAHIDKIYYANTKADAAKIGFDDAFLYEEFKKTPENRRVPIQSLLANEAQTVFKEWQQKDDKILY